jgi:PAS domain S-box-containing protein
MSESDLDREIEQSRRRLASLRERADREGHGSDSPLQEAIEELGQTLEELAITLEELASSNEELGEAQLAAEQHARRYLELFRSAPDSYVVTDGRGVIRELNEMAEQKLGRPGRYLAGKPLLSLVAAPDRDVFLECLSALRDRRARLEGRLMRFGSEPGFDASVSAEPELRDSDLEIRWLLSDVTERRRIEKALRASEARMRALAHSLRVLISYLDREERYQFNNAACEVWFGIPPEKLAGMHLREVLGDEAYQRIRPHVQAVLAGEPQLFEARLHYAPEGTRDVMVEYEPDVRENGEVVGFYALVIDVSALKRAEQEARETEARIRAVLDAALDGILGVDEAGVIRSVNPAACRMFGYAASGLIGREASGLLRLPGRQRSRPSLVALAGTVREMVGIRQDGSRLPIQVSFGQARAEKGRTFVATVRDLSGQRTLESQLRAATTAAAVAEDRERRRLAADLHDDVSQLLTLAGMKLGMLRGAARGREVEVQLREVGDLVARAHERTESLTFQLSPPILHDVGLAAAAEWLAEEMGRSYGLRVQVVRSAEPPLGEAVRITLFRALRELLINVARHAGTHEARVTLVQEGDCLTTIVEDGGLGFDRGQVGAGFGLVSIRERVEALGGRFEIDSEVGRGTRACMVVPLAGGEHD